MSADDFMAILYEDGKYHGYHCCASLDYCNVNDYKQKGVEHFVVGTWQEAVDLADDEDSEYGYTFVNMPIGLDVEVAKCLIAEADAIPDRANMEWASGALENYVVLMYEIGSACKDYIYSARSGDAETIRARAANAVVELSDVVCQALIAFSKIKLLTNSLKNLTVEEFIRDGLERQQERMAEVKARSINYGNYSGNN